jgi:PAS domain S-box-containing protein
MDAEITGVIVAPPHRLLPRQPPTRRAGGQRVVLDSAAAYRPGRNVAAHKAQARVIEVVAMVIVDGGAEGAGPVVAPLLCIVAVSLFVFGGPWAMGTMTYLYLLFPFLSWAAFQFGRHGAVTGVNVMPAIAVWGTVQGFGAFSSETLHAALFDLQAFMSSAAMTSLVLAAAVAERRHLEEVRAQLAAMVESSDDAIISETIAGMIVSWNRGAERIYGYSADEVHGRPMAILVPPERPDDLPPLLERLIRGERIEPYETTGRRKDGRPIHIAVTLA